MSIRNDLGDWGHECSIDQDRVRGEGSRGRGRTVRSEARSPEVRCCFVGCAVRASGTRLHSDTQAWADAGIGSRQKGNHMRWTSSSKEAGKAAQKQETGSTDREVRRGREGWDTCWDTLTGSQRTSREAGRARVGRVCQDKEGTSRRTLTNTVQGSEEARKGLASTSSGRSLVTSAKHFRGEEGGGARLQQAAEGTAGQVRRWP